MSYSARSCGAHNWEPSCAERPTTTRPLGLQARTKAAVLPMLGLGTATLNTDVHMHISGVTPFTSSQLLGRGKLHRLLPWLLYARTAQPSGCPGHWLQVAWRVTSPLETAGVAHSAPGRGDCQIDDGPGLKH